jgi:hypothetical protein
MREMPCHGFKPHSRADPYRQKSVPTLGATLSGVHRVVFSFLFHIFPRASGDLLAQIQNLIFPLMLSNTITDKCIRAACSLPRRGHFSHDLLMEI